MTTEHNPWVSQPLVPAVAIEPPSGHASAGVRGPLAPQLGVPAPDRADQLATRTFARDADLFVVGAHGGAGESSLAALSPSWVATDHAWPHIASSSSRARVVLVARSNMQGLLAAQRAATQWGSGLVPFVDVLGLVIVADAPGKLPRPLRDFAAVVAGGVPRVWKVPWSEALRLGEQPNPATAHKDVRALVTDLTAILTGAARTAH
ncbi:DUF6668 family protein [Pseudoclavibacter sp. Z016]|uniref:DUF6668 family protein n=1 Tax=Pseudoclavibacter sp. Z016 TaxID=2080581 RepID=UPI000CE8F10B|nr:DUF6668 family protein [Pseudoclavibacter sp. Z016]PPF72630.1 hypothetical protein C5B99_17480 [Pseudoclavibacter sp. Z016]